MSEETKKEKAGAKAPAASSKVEETQNKQVSSDTGPVALDAEIAKLKGEVADKDAEIAKLKKEIEDLKSKVAELSPKPKKKGDPVYTVSTAFRDNTSKDGKVIPIGSDVSHFKQERLDSLVNRGLVTKS